MDNGLHGRHGLHGQHGQWTIWTDRHQPISEEFLAQSMLSIVHAVHVVHVVHESLLNIGNNFLERSGGITNLTIVLDERDECPA